MLINREQLVRRHNPKLDGISTESPLSVGNGNFAFTMDITGMQSLYAHYLEGGFPLCSLCFYSQFLLSLLSQLSERSPSASLTPLPSQGASVS